MRSCVWSSFQMARSHCVSSPGHDRGQQAGRGARGSGNDHPHPAPSADARGVRKEDSVGSRVPGFSVPTPATDVPIRTPVLRPGSVSESFAGGAAGRGYVACVPLPPLHPAAWFKGSAMQFRPHPSHSGRSTASADDLASALPDPPAFPPAPRGGSVSRPHTRTRGVRGSASRRGSWQRAGFRWNPS